MSSRARHLDAIHTQLSNGMAICLRRVGPDDEKRLKQGIAELTPQSRYLRFFTGMREAPQHVIDKLVNADGHHHIAWGALRTDEADMPALGAVHAFRDAADTAQAEFAIAVADAYHGLGLARILTAVLLLDCQRAGLERLTMHILWENNAARALVRSVGAVGTGQDSSTLELEIDIAEAIRSLRDEREFEGLKPVFAYFEG